MDNRMNKDNATRGFQNIDSQQNSQGKNQNSNGNNNNNRNLKELKQETARELGIDLNKGGAISSRDAGRVGGNMVKKMVQQYEDNNANN